MSLDYKYIKQILVALRDNPSLSMGGHDPAKVAWMH